MNVLKVVVIAVVALSLSACFGSNPKIKSLPGYTDFNLPVEMQREARIDISLGKSSLRPVRWVIGAALQEDEHTAAQIALTQAVLDSIEAVHVRGFDVRGNADDIEDSVSQTVGYLKRAGWRTLLTVHEDDQQIVVMQAGGEEIIQGLSIVVTNPREVFYINILGELIPNELMQVASQFPLNKEV